MKKTQRLLIGFAATCACFFVIMLAGSFVKPAAGIEASGKDIISDDATPSDSPANKNNTPTSFPSPTTVPKETLSPTPSATPTVTPTPTLSPTPTVTPTPTPSPTATPSPTPVPQAYIPNFTIPAVTKNLNIRKTPGTGTGDKIIGKLPADCYAFILEENNGWTKITTGTIEEGYVSSGYLFSPEEVITICDREELVTAYITASVLNVRSGPGTWYDSLTKVKKGQSFKAKLGQSYKDWIAIEYKNGSIGYISEKYVKFAFNMDTGMTLKELEEKELQDAITKAFERAQIFSVPETTRKPMTMTEDELYLFATVIYTESGDQGYNGMLAVANIILNRIENGHWGDTLEEVLFSPGQFAGARQELIDRAQARGIPQSCYTVAKDALAGRNNIGDFLFFRTTDSAMRVSDYLTYTEFYILKDHVFYRKNW